MQCIYYITYRAICSCETEKKCVKQPNIRQFDKHRPTDDRAQFRYRGSTRNLESL